MKMGKHQPPRFRLTQLGMVMHLHWRCRLYLKRLTMSEILSVEATLTDRYQNTVPAAVRKALYLAKGDKVRYAISDAGEVTLSRTDSEPTDPIIDQFLSFLANDMQKHPDQLQPVTADLHDRIDALVGEMDINLNEPLSEEDE
jgi:antitoxin PrlF